MARWINDGSHHLIRWECDWSSQTGAAQTGILHGTNEDIPAFRWWDKEAGREVSSSRPRDVAAIEERISNGKGLLYADGASRANMYSGDAPYSLLTMSTVLRRDRPGRIGSDYFAYFANPYNLTRTIALVIADISSELWQAAQQKRLDIRPRVHRGLQVLVRPRLDDRRPARPAGRLGRRRHLRRAPRALHDVHRLRRGRPPLGDRAPRDAEDPPQARPAVRAPRAGRGRRAQACALRRALRPRPDAGNDVPRPVRHLAPRPGHRGDLGQRPELEPGRRRPDVPRRVADRGVGRHGSPGHVDADDDQGPDRGRRGARRPRRQGGAEGRRRGGQGRRARPRSS